MPGIKVNKQQVQRPFKTTGGRAPAPPPRKPRQNTMPPKPKKEKKKKKENVVSKVIDSTDVRSAKTETSTVLLNNQLASVTLQKTISQGNLFWVAAGYVIKALEKGFAASADFDYYPYYAAYYMSNLFVQYATGGVPPTLQLPYWILCLCHAISPKITRLGHGSASYRLSVSTFQPTVSQPIGYSGYGNTFTLGWPNENGTPVAGFPVIVTTPISYTDEEGSLAFQQLAQFMISIDRDNKEYQLVPSSSFTPFQKDVSCFAVVKLAQGMGCTGFGGAFFAQIQHEVPIVCPQLVWMTAGDDTSSENTLQRVYNRSITVSGDPCFLGAMLSSTISTNQLYMKRQPKFKFIDFLEFGDVLAMWVTKITQANFDNMNKEFATLEDAIDYLCPITLQEMLLLIRNVFMGVFKDSQAAVQGISPFIPQSDTSNQFTPFVAGSNTCYVSSVDPLLPIPLIENARCLVMRHIDYSKRGGADLEFFIPVLGQYQLDKLVYTDYEVTINIAGTPTVVTAFVDPNDVWKEVKQTEKGEVTIPMVEPVISLIDGSYASGLLAINQPNQLKKLAMDWDDWLESSGVGSYSTTLGTMSTELGINMLASIAMTREWASFIPPTNKSDKKKVSQIKDVRRERIRRKAAYSTVYAQRQAVVDLSQGPILSCPYDEVLQTWILPTIQYEGVIGTNQSTVPQRYQSMMDETYSTSKSVGEQGVTLSFMHATYASKMTKANLAAPDVWTNFFKEMADQGRGGILSGLVANLVGTAVPSLAGVANNIASLFPI